VAQKRARCRVVDVLFGDELVETGVDREDARRRVDINRDGEAPLAGDEPEVAPGDLLAEVRVEMARLNSRAPPEPARDEDNLGPAVTEAQSVSAPGDGLDER